MLIHFVGKDGRCNSDQKTRNAENNSNKDFC